MAITIKEVLRSITALDKIILPIAMILGALFGGLVSESDPWIPGAAVGLLFGFLVYLLGRALLLMFLWGVDTGPNMPPGAPKIEVASALVNANRRRARQLRLAARLVLFTIILTLAAGVSSLSMRTR